MRRVASIPNVIVTEMYRRGINIFSKDDWPKVAALLDSPDFRKFRTSPGTISRKPYREHLRPRQRRRNL